jgi:hypothetical protein
VLRTLRPYMRLTHPHHPPPPHRAFIDHKRYKNLHKSVLFLHLLWFLSFFENNLKKLSKIDYLCTN